MSIFPHTPHELIRSLKDVADGQDDARWARFVELYEPAIRDFIRLQDPDMSEVDRDDIVQDAFVRMVPAIRNGVFDPAKGRFRNFLAAVVRNLMVDRLREIAVRSSETAVAAASRLNVDMGPAAAELLDVKWRLARHHAAVERVFAQQNTHTVMGTAQASGVALLLAAEAGLPAATHTPSTVPTISTQFGTSRLSRSRTSAAMETIAAIWARSPGMVCAPAPARMVSTAPQPISSPVPASTTDRTIAATHSKRSCP